MWMVHDILYSMTNGKERRFCGSIHVPTQSHSKILKVVPSLKSDMHDTSYPMA